MTWTPIAVFRSIGRRLLYNSTSGRLRAGWRLCVCLFLFLVGFFTSAMTVDAFLTGMAADLFSVLGLLASSVIAVGVTARYLDERSIAYFGLHVDGEWWLDLAAGVIVGTAIPALVFGVYLTAGWASVEGFLASPEGHSLRVVLVVSLVLMAAVSVGEELLVRGYVMHTLADGVRRLPTLLVVSVAWIGSAGLFMWFHNMQVDVWYEAAHFMAAGLLLGLPVLLRGELGMAIGIHLGYNFAISYVFGLREEPALLVVTVDGPSQWTGMAGFTETLAVVLAAVPIVFWIRWRSNGLSLAPPFSGGAVDHDIESK